VYRDEIILHRLARRGERVTSLLGQHTADQVLILSDLMWRAAGGGWFDGAATRRCRTSWVCTGKAVTGRFFRETALLFIFDKFLAI
jgi:hypothetical protein